MKIRSSIAIAALAASSLASAVASADIGFFAAVQLSRNAVPGSTLLSVESRIRNGIWVYEGDLYNDAATLKSTPRLNRDTGAIIQIETDATDAEEAAQVQAIFALLDTATIDFMDAIEIANEAAQQEATERAKLEIEHGILAFQVDYFDGTQVDVDAVTGGVIPHHGEGDEIEATLPSTAILPAIAAAELEAGAGWRTVGLETESEKGGSIVEVLMLNPKSGQLGLATVVGETVTNFVEFTPVGNQAARVAEITAVLGSIQLDVAGAVAAAEAAYPGAGINEIELEVETEKTGTTVFWKLALVTEDLTELDFFVDATVPAGGNGFRFATAPTNYVPGDLNRDGVVNAIDLAEILSAFGFVNPLLDLNGNGLADAADLATVLSNWTQN
ncbi:MAG: hypothetical protein RLY21_2186 [Planctomycetota bacterium]|jgi:hypothetical protein